MDRPPWAPGEVDMTLPGVARVYDYYVHEVAHARNPEARTVYVGHDPVAVTHSRELPAGHARRPSYPRRVCLGFNQVPDGHPVLAGVARKG